MTVHRASDRSSAPQAYQFKITQSAGATQGFIWKEITWPPGKKKQQQSRVFFGPIFYVYTIVENREGARASS